jgi:hypothetical protein
LFAKVCARAASAISLGWIVSSLTQSRNDEWKPCGVYGSPKFPHLVSPGRSIRDEAVAIAEKGCPVARASARLRCVMKAPCRARFSSAVACVFDNYVSNSPQGRSPFLCGGKETRMSDEEKRNGPDRRSGERRASDAPDYEGTERRKGERRSGKDRRTS